MAKRNGNRQMIKHVKRQEREREREKERES